MSMPRKKAAVLISGRGSNMAALVNAAKEREFPAEIVGVVSDRADAPGLSFATSEGIATRVVARDDFPGRPEHETALGRALAEIDAEIVCLAGFMRILSPQFVAKWSGRMINIHPSLLPLFPGLESHSRALEAGVTLHGCSVHFVTAEMDAGPIIAQAAVPVLAGDDADKLAARVLRAEHKLYPAALSLVAQGHASMRDGRTVFAGDQPATTNTMLISPAPSPLVGSEAADLEQLARFTP